MDGRRAAPAVDKPHGRIAFWLRKLDASWASPECIFKHCVSPSPLGKSARLGMRRAARVRTATKTTGLASTASRRRRSIHIHIKGEASELGRIIGKDYRTLRASSSPYRARDHTIRSNPWVTWRISARSSAVTSSSVARYFLRICYIVSPRSAVIAPSRASSSRSPVSAAASVVCNIVSSTSTIAAQS